MWVQVLPRPSKASHWWTLCHSGLSAADEVNHISGSHIWLLGLSNAAGVRVAATCRKPALGFCASDKTARSKEMNPVQTWVTCASFPKGKSKEISSNSLWNKGMVGEWERECSEGALPCIDVTSETAKLKICYGHSTIPNPFQQATILVSWIQKDLRLRAKAD